MRKVGLKIPQPRASLDQEPDIDAVTWFARRHLPIAENAPLKVILIDRGDVFKKIYTILSPDFRPHYIVRVTIAFDPTQKSLAKS
jgi:hypothetical protein